MSTQLYDVIVIGAGAAGLMCAIEAGKRGKTVCIIEHANKPGKKILMSGGGRCNFTNKTVTSECYISHNPHFVKSALSRYQPEDFIKLVKKHRIAFHEKTLGQLFCDDKSKDILNMLLAECEHANVAIHLNTRINTIKNENNDQFHIFAQGMRYVCSSLVVATGGLSIPTMGASPFGYQIAQQFGLSVWPTRAGLVPFTLHKEDKERLSLLSGISIPCEVHAKNKAFKEAMLFTHRGLSGPAMLQISSYWQPGESLTVNLLPGDDLLALIKTAKQQSSQWSVKRFLNAYFPKRFVELWLDDQLLEMSLADLSFAQCGQITDSFQKWAIVPNATEGYRTAEITIGGVDCDAISSKTFEAKNTKGLYFIGEVLDVAGWLGGYNFQWAWASGYCAGQYV